MFSSEARISGSSQVEYVSNTNRLKTTFGEVRPTDDFELEEKKTKKKRTNEEDEE